KLLSHFESATPELQVHWKAAVEKLRLATSGSAALPVSLAEKWKALTGKYPLERFGMTEVGVALSNPLVGKRKPGRVGLPLPSVQYKVVNEVGEPSEVGELWIGGPSVFSEYFRCPEATQNAFTEEDGIRFFKTGDTVTRDEEGYFKVLGRNSVDILKSGGYKLSAIEIEEVFRTHPAVGEVAVVGIPDDIWGDRVIACVVLKKELEAPCSENLLREFSKSQMASYKVPKQVVFLEKLPSNALGKVLKQDLVKQLKSGIIS
ncbi:MAG: AMP-binding protein, partial [Bdellovibrionia bacterium]